MTNIFRPIDGETILPDRILQGQPWGNISFGVNATIADYQAKGLYWETGDKPAYTKYQYLSAVTETINHIDKEVELTWTVLDKTQAEIDEIDRVEEIADVQESDGLKTITIDQAEAYIDNHVDQITNIATNNTQLKIIFKRMFPYLMG